MIDTIASDHSPCPPEGKAGPTPFAGVSGVQTTLSLLLGSNQLSLPEITQLRTAAARLQLGGAAISIAPIGPDPSEVRPVSEQL